VDEGSEVLEETTDDETPGVGNVDSFPDEEVDDKCKVVGTIPSASGSRPMFRAAATSKLFVSCIKLGAISIET
jgi:hypothetical protein